MRHSLQPMTRIALFWRTIRLLLYKVIKADVGRKLFSLNKRPTLREIFPSMDLINVMPEGN